MLFNSITFLIFFVVVSTLYFAIPHKFRWLLLLLASCYFYMAFIPVYILILGCTILIDYFAGLQIEKSNGKNRRLFLVFSLIANIGILAFFKYYNFLNSNLSLLLHFTGQRNPFPYLSILLPIGLSFHTFQAMSYTIEVYRGKQKAERHFGIYALYVMFYPQLVAGPIERPQNMIHQFHEKHDFEYERVTNGLKLMLWGFFKKIVIADHLALVSNNVFDHYHSFNGAAFFLGMIAFAIQIFCDFSGYSDIAIGSAQVMGFKLMTNFNRPFFSRSVTEFWRRWHISLSTWFNDYLFTPLIVANRDWGKLGVVFALMITFFVSGLWHGAGWTFIVFGLMHGTAMAYEFLTKKTRKTWSKTVPKIIYNNVSVALTFLFAAFSWIFFRSHDLGEAKYIITHLFKSWQAADIQSALWVWGAGNANTVLMLSFIAVLLSVGFYRENFGSVSQLISKQKLVIRWSAYFFLIFSIALFGVFENIQFIYFQF